MKKINSNKELEKIVSQFKKDIKSVGLCALKKKGYRETKLGKDGKYYLRAYITKCKKFLIKHRGTITSTPYNEFLHLYVPTIMFGIYDHEFIAQPLCNISEKAKNRAMELIAKTFLKNKWIKRVTDITYLFYIFEANDIDFHWGNVAMYRDKPVLIDW